MLLASSLFSVVVAAAAPTYLELCYDTVDAKVAASAGWDGMGLDLCEMQTTSMAAAGS